MHMQAVSALTTMKCCGVLSRKIICYNTPFPEMQGNIV